jgi:molecular chaperone DnaK
MNRTIGIDLGTTNTVGAIEGAALASAAEGGAILPSVVAFPPSGATLVGAPAKKRRAIDPKNTIFSAKRLMGKSWHSYNATAFRKQYPFDLIATSGEQCAFKTRAGAYTPSDIAAYVVGKLLSMHRVDPMQTDAVIAVPASFDEPARQATVDAAHKAGLRQVSTVAEPVATAVAYLEQGRQGYNRVAVYDFGGGTFDLAILDASTHPARVIAHGGDPYLGGDDIDRALANWAAARALEHYGWDLRSEAETSDRLTLQCERAKIRLGLAPQTRIELSQIDPGAPAAAEAVSLDRETMKRVSDPFVARTFLICDQVLRDAGVATSDVDAVLLAGGTTLMPTVREAVTRYFGAPAHAEFDPLEVVSIGASRLRA